MIVVLTKICNKIWKLGDSLKTCTGSNAALTKLKPIWRDKQHISLVKAETDALPFHIHISVRVRAMDLNSRAREKDVCL